MCELDETPSGIFMPFSSYSFLRGLVSPDALMSWARRKGYRSSVPADLGNFYALPLTVAAAEKEGIKALAASAIALDREGFGCLCDVLSRRFEARAAAVAGRGDRAWPGDGDGAPGDPLSWVLERGGRGIALLSPHPDVLLRLKAGGCPNFYGELAAGLPARALAAFCRREGIPLVAANAALARDALDIYRRELLRASATRRTLAAYGAGIAEAAGRPWYPEGAGEGARLEDLPEFAPDPSWAFRSAEEMRSLFSALPEALAAGEDIMERAEPASAFLSPCPIFPPYEPPLPGGGFGHPAPIRGGGSGKGGRRSAPRARARRHRLQGLRDLLPRGQGHSPFLPAHLRAGERGVEHRVLPSRPHPRGSPRARSLLRPLPERGEERSARHRH
jgi:hypothetical protein